MLSRTSASRELFGCGRTRHYIYMNEKTSLTKTGTKTISIQTILWSTHPSLLPFSTRASASACATRSRLLYSYSQISLGRHWPAPPRLSISHFAFGCRKKKSSNAGCRGGVSGFGVCGHVCSMTEHCCVRLLLKMAQLTAANCNSNRNSNQPQTSTTSVNSQQSVNKT